jgi:hypothetical protein
LPDTSHTKDNKLDKCPANDAGVGVFGLIAELGFALLQNVLASIFRFLRDVKGPKHTLWKTCSLRTSCNLEFKSLTFCTSVSTLSLSVLSILLVSPIAMSSVNLTVPCTPELNQPPLLPGTFWGVTQILC